MEQTNAFDCPHPPPIPEAPALDRGDREIVLLAYGYRFLTAEQIGSLTGMEAGELGVRLERLRQNRFLARLRKPVLWEEEAGPWAYALDRVGANLVAAETGVDRAEVKWSRSRNRVQSLFLQHALSVNDARVAFTLSAQQHPDHELFAWRQGRQIADRVPDPEDGTKLLPLCPDAYLCYRVGARRSHFFLEVDLGTETNRRFREKVRAYIAYRQSGRFRERYRAYAFRVLTLTTSQKRLANLRRAAEAAGGGSMFWFGTLQAAAHGSVRNTYWQIAGPLNTISHLWG